MAELVYAALFTLYLISLDVPRKANQDPSTFINKVAPENPIKYNVDCILYPLELATHFPNQIKTSRRRQLN
jgi:hypothetical protein